MAMEAEAQYAVEPAGLKAELRESKETADTEVNALPEFCLQCSQFHRMMSLSFHGHVGHT